MKKVINRLLTINPAYQPTYHLVRGYTSNIFDFRKPSSISFRCSNFLFIVGSGRSGNTLLRRLLMERAEIYIPPETYVLGAIVAKLLRNRNLDWSEQVDASLSLIEYHPEFETFGIESLRKFAIRAKSWPSSQQQCGRLVYELYKWLASEKKISAEWVGDKTPLNTLRLGLIDKLLPSAKYIYIERDPGDVVASYIAAGIYSRYEDAAERWLMSKLAWKSFKRRLKQSNYLELKYEYLVCRPYNISNSIVMSFGIPLRENPIEVISLLGDVTVKKHHEAVIDRVTTDSIGKGRDTLPADIRNRIGKILGKELAESGYQPL